MERGHAEALLPLVDRVVSNVGGRICEPRPGRRDGRPGELHRACASASPRRARSGLPPGSRWSASPPCRRSSPRSSPTITGGSSPPRSTPARPGLFPGDRARRPEHRRAEPRARAGRGAADRRRPGRARRLRRPGGRGRDRPASTSPSMIRSPSRTSPGWRGSASSPTPPTPCRSRSICAGPTRGRRTGPAAAPMSCRTGCSAAPATARIAPLSTPPRRRGSPRSMPRPSPGPGTRSSSSARSPRGTSSPTGSSSAAVRAGGLHPVAQGRRRGRDPLGRDRRRAARGRGHSGAAPRPPSPDAWRRRACARSISRSRKATARRSPSTAAAASARSAAGRATTRGRTAPAPPPSR